MGEIYAPKHGEEKKEIPTLQEDLKEIVTSFGEASVKAAKTLLYLPQPEEKEEDQGGLKLAIGGAFTPLTAYAFMVFVLLYMPCVVAIAAMRQEFGTWKWAAVGLLYQTALAWGAALIVYQGGRLLGLGG